MPTPDVTLDHADLTIPDRTQVYLRDAAGNYQICLPSIKSILLVCAVPGGMRTKYRWRHSWSGNPQVPRSSSRTLMEGCTKIAEISSQFEPWGNTC